MAEATAEELALAQPEAPETAAIEAWYMDDSPEDQRLPHKQHPNKPCSLAALRDLGVLYWKLDADKHDTDPRLAAIRKVQNYSYMEIVNISKDTLPGYDDKLKMFYQEHLHTDDEIRFILDGSGYFDVRDHADQWIRIHTKKGDLISLPEGIYHRFTLDASNYTKAMRLFVGEPIWTPLNRPQEEHPSRSKYTNKFGAASASA